MSNNLYSQENIEAYLNNKLKGAQKAEFENGLAKDPLLKNEVTLQQDIINSIKNTRRLELKNRLNAIKVPATAPSYLRYQVAASIVVGLGIIGSIFLLPLSDDEPSQHPVKNIAINHSSEGIDKKPTEEISVMNSSPMAERQVKTLENPADVNITKGENIIKNKSINKTTPIDEPLAEVNSPEVKELEEEVIQTDHTLIIPKGEVAENVTDITSEVQVSIQPSGENNFHYQFYSNKLYLYCDFNSQPYELIELNKKNSKKLYLHFNNSFYELKNNQFEIAPLKNIKNQELIKQLQSMKH